MTGNIEAGKSSARETTGAGPPVLGLVRAAVHRGSATSLREGLAVEANLLSDPQRSPQA